MRAAYRSALAGLVLLLAACGDSAAPTAAPLKNLRGQSSATAPPAKASVQVPSLQGGAPHLLQVGNFSQPVLVTAPRGDRRIFVVEKTGRVRVVTGGSVLTAAFLDLSGEVSQGGEQGLLSIAFAPDFATSELVYADLTDRAGNTQVLEFHVRGDAVDPGTRRTILSVAQPFANHNGGLLAFDPSGMLVVGLGDGGSGGDPGNRAQDLGTMLGKLLRIDPRHPGGGRAYGIPSDNPFVKRSGALPEIWAYGLRNPWRFSFDGDVLYIGDVGQDTVEEVDVAAPAQQGGANYGWRVYEGDRVFNQAPIDRSHLVAPLLTYLHSGGGCSITGGYVYRGHAAALQGQYLYGDYCLGQVMSATFSGSHLASNTPVSGMHVNQLSSFGQDGHGEVYVCSLDGGVYRIDAG